jgi:hypothetical protein
VGVAVVADEDADDVFAVDPEVPPAQTAESGDALTVDVVAVALGYLAEVGTVFGFEVDVDGAFGVIGEVVGAEREYPEADEPIPVAEVVTPVPVAVPVASPVVVVVAVVM